MTTATVEHEFVELENRYWRAIRDGDASAAMQLADDPCVVTGAQGVGSIDRKTLGGMLKSSTWKLLDFEISDVQVRRLTDDVAVVAYKVIEQLTVEGKPLTLNAADASTWVRRDGRWVCALHTESIAGDPFGRDRSKTP
jgi:uncharacterized protein (TIGR02246 family)